MAVASNQTPPKRGHLIIDGTSYDANNEGFIDQLLNFGKSNLNSSQQPYFKGIIDALNRGEDVTFSSLNNEVSPNVQLQGLNNRQERRMNRDRSKAGMWFDSIFGSKVDNAARALDSLRNFRYIAPEAPKAQPLEKTNINFTDRYIDYITDKNGKKIYSNRPSNTAIISDINNLINYFELGDKGDESYNVSGININAVRDYYNKYSGELAAIRDRIQSGTLTENDWKVLNDLRILQNQSNEQILTSQQQEEIESQKIRQALGLKKDTWKDAKFSNINGRIRIDNWQDLFNGYDKAVFTESSPLAGTKCQNWFGYNGFLYSPEEVERNVDNIGTIFQPFRNAWNKFDFDAINSAGVQYWPNNVTWSEFNREQHYHPTLWTATRNVKLNPGQSLYATTLSNAYDLPNGASLQAYINPNDPRHLSGIPQKIHYIAYDPNRENTDGSHYFEYTDVSQIPYKLRSAINQGNPAKFNRFDWQKVSNNLKVARYGELIDQNDKINYGIYRGDDGAIYIQVGNDYKQVKNLDLFSAIKDRRVPAIRANINMLFEGPKGSSNEYKGRTALQQANANYVQQQYKTGGKIPKYQFGNVFKEITTKGVNSEPKQTVINNLSDITQGAAVKNIFKEGELTPADKWQLGAIAGDLSALIASIPTGGNPVAAGLGFGSTISQFVSDVKRDGLDWGDAGRALGSLGLDMITLIPGVGIAGKTAKTIKVLKNSAKLIGSTFAAAGLVNAAQSLSNLTEDGKEWTIDDLRNVATGLQSVIGLKRLAFDKRLATKKLPKENKVTPVNNIETRKQALVDEKLKNDATLAEKYVGENGKVDYDKASKELISKSELAKLNVSKITDSAKQRGKKFVNRFKAAPREIREAQYTAKGFWPRMMQTMRNRAIARYQIDNPDKFGTRFVIGSKESGWTGEQVPVYGQVRNNTTLNNGFLLFHSPYAGREQSFTPIGLSKKATEKAIKNQIVPTKIQDGLDSEGNLTYRYFVNTPRGTEYETDDMKELIQYLRSHKSGGKIQKFAPGGLFDFVSKLGRGTQTINAKLPKIDQDSLYSLTGLIGSRVYNRKFHDEIEKGIRSGYNATLSAPQEIYDSFNTYGVPIAYENKAVREENYKPVTSDAVLANALEQQGQSQANQTRLEGRLKTSELFSDYLNRNNDLKRRYAQVRADVANQNRQIIANVNMQLAQNKASKLANDFTSFNNWLMEKRAKNTLNEEKRNAINSTLLQGKLEHELSGQMRDLMKPYRDQFDTWYKDDANKDIRDNYSFESWLSEYKPEEYNSIQNQLYNLKVKSLIPYYNSLFKRPQFNAETYTNVLSQRKGGKVSSHNRYPRPAHEEIWIQQNKAANEAVKSLNNNIVRLFIKATSHENKKI